MTVPQVFHRAVMVLCFGGELVNHDDECGICAIMCIVKSFISFAEIIFSRVGWYSHIKGFSTYAVHTPTVQTTC